MAKDFYFMILEKAEKNGLFDSVNVSKELRDEIRNSKIANTKPSNWWDLPNQLLMPLVEKDYIHYIRIGFTEEEKYPVPNDWIDRLTAIITLHPQGLLFLYEKQKVDEIKRGNSLTRAFIIVTAIVGLGTLIASSITLSITVSENNYRQQLTQQKIHISQQDTLIKRLRQDSVQVHSLYHNKVLQKK